MMTLKRSLLVAASLVTLVAGSASAQTVVNTVKVENGGLYEVVFNPADKDIYVASVGPRGANSAQVIRLNGQTLADDGAINVSEYPLYGLGLNTVTQILYGTDTRQGAVTAINVRTDQVVAQAIKADPSVNNAHVRQVVVDEASNKVYISVVGGDASDAENTNKIWVIDGATNTVERTITVPLSRMTGLAHDASTNRLYVTGLNSNNVAAIDLSNDQIVGTWAAGGEGSVNVAVDSAGRRLFVTNQGSGTLTVLNADNGELIRTITTGEGALSVAYNPTVKQIYVANRRAGTVSVIDSDSYEVKANLATGTFPQTIAIDRETNLVYVTNKARGAPRGAPAGTPVPVDATGDVVAVIRP